MNPKILLRVASLLMAFHLIGHSLGHSGWKKTTDPVKKEVITQMTDHSFPFMGTIRSMGTYYDGYGYACSIALLLFAIVLWIIASSKNLYSDLSLKILLSTSFCLFIWGIDELMFFFPFAASFTIASALLTLFSFFQIKKTLKE